MPEEMKAAPFGPSLTPAAPEEDANGFSVAREKLLRPRVWPLPAAAMAATAMVYVVWTLGLDGFVL
jgi:hypothetical protein